LILPNILLKKSRLVKFLWCKHKKEIIRKKWRQGNFRGRQNVVLCWQRKDHFSRPQVAWAWLLSRFLHFRRKNSSLRSSSEKIAFMTFSVGLKHISKNWNHCRNPGLRKVFCFFNDAEKSNIKNLVKKIKNDSLTKSN
jgi:hypothetical protein